MGNYWANALGETVAGAAGPAGIFLPPLITPVLHLYFDLFSGFVQTFVFILLTMIFVLQEQNEESLAKTLTEFVLDTTTNKYKAETVNLKLLD